MLQIGQPAPVFDLPDADMEMVSLASFRNRRNVVVYFYPRDNTPGCTLESTDFSDLQDEFELTALDYCVTYEVSPPSWEPSKGVAREGSASAATVSTQLSVIGDAVTTVQGGDLQGLAITTLMACPPGQPKPIRFVTLSGDPVLAPYNVSLPIVVYLPERLELRWRVWRPMDPLQPALAL